MREMTRVEVQDVLKTTDTVIVPLRSLEEHGPHDPVGCCFILANESARLVGAKTGVPVTPTIPFGAGRGFENFPGSGASGDARHTTEHISDYTRRCIGLYRHNQTYASNLRKIASLSSS
jgi:creatinine amidohydrolase/Fe(II)-dependent formamide hydrolase-like protein